MLPEFAKSLYFRFHEAEIPLLLAGGWAVCHHGYSRLTLDVDWICQRSNQDRAALLMKKLGFRKSSDGMASRFKHQTELAYPFIDLIWVDDDSFSKMSQPDPSDSGEEVAVVNFRALLAMKLFALKDDHIRHGKDLLDIRNLLAYRPGEISDQELQAMCERYATLSFYQKIKGDA